MRHETHAAKMERLLRTLPPAVRGMGFGDPDDAEYAHASDVVAWAINEIARLREERRWIPVGERLPEEARRVWAFVPAVYGAQAAKWVDGHWCDHFGRVGPVTHWMPLPAWPKGGEVGE